MSWTAVYITGVAVVLALLTFVNKELGPSERMPPPAMILVSVFWPIVLVFLAILALTGEL